MIDIEVGEQIDSGNLGASLVYSAVRMVLAGATSLLMTKPFYTYLEDDKNPISQRTYTADGTAFADINARVVDCFPNISNCLPEPGWSELTFFAYVAGGVLVSVELIRFLFLMMKQFLGIDVGIRKIKGGLIGSEIALILGQGAAILWLFMGILQTSPDVNPTIYLLGYALAWMFTLGSRVHLYRRLNKAKA